MATVHTVAQTGFGSGTNDLYDRVRPGYQPWALQHIRENMRSAGPYNIVEIGSGTGIFTRTLLNDPEWSLRTTELQAVEPSAGMRKVFTNTVHDERVKVRDGTFDTTGVEDGWADLVVIAQAFHWCPNYELAAEEFRRVLKPNGVVAFIWNLEDRDGARWAAQVRDLIEQHEQGTPQFRLGLWRQLFETPSYKNHFHAPDEKVWSYHLDATTDVVVDRASSKSYVAVLPSDEKERVREEMRGILKRGDDLEWIDEQKGVFKYPYRTWVVISRKR